jgi:hypothetical protein
MGRSIARIVAVLLLAATGVLGVYGGITERVDARTPFQVSVTAGVLLYGALGLVGTYAVLRRRAWGVWSVTAWAVLITYVSGTAALAYAGEDASLVGAVSAAVAAALVGAFVVWAVRPGSSPPELAGSDPPPTH